MNVLPRATCYLLITLVHNFLHPRPLYNAEQLCIWGFFGFLCQVGPLAVIFLFYLSLFSAGFREKKLLVSSEDYGRDLTGVQNLRKKHKRLEAELAAHEPAIQVNAFPRDRFLYKQHLFCLWKRWKPAVVLLDPNQCTRGRQVMFQ